MTVIYNFETDYKTKYDAITTEINALGGAFVHPTYTAGTGAEATAATASD